MKIRTSAAVAKASSAAALARVLSITPSAVSQWGEYMPPLQAYRLKELKPRWIAGLLVQSQVAQEAA